MVESKERIIPATFYVVKGDTKTEPLLSYNTAKNLRIITIHGAAVNTVQEDSVRHEESDNTQHKGLIKEKIIHKYPEIVCGIGKMEGALVDLHVDHSVEPVAQPHRRIPFSVRPPLEKELLKFEEEEDIIEKVEKPTGWVSATVITPKK